MNKRKLLSDFIIISPESKTPREAHTNAQKVCEMRKRESDRP